MIALLKQLAARLRFALSHRTLQRIVALPTDPSHISVCHRGRIVVLRRRCLHQGGPLDKGYIEGDDLVCPWHGCRYSLVSPGPARPYVPTLPKNSR